MPHEGGSSGKRKKAKDVLRLTVAEPGAPHGKCSVNKNVQG
jgi:hypothetical protein